MSENMREVKRLIVASTRGVRQGYAGTVEVCCVNCGIWKALPYFGMRYMRPADELRNQSWCNRCRAEERQAAGAR